MKDYRIFLESRNESWQDALNRYQRFCDADMKEYFATKDYSYRFADNDAYKYHKGKRVMDKWIGAFSSLHAMKVPDTLSNMLCQHGGFCIGHDMLKIFDNNDADIFRSITEMVNEYGDAEFVSKISPTMLKSVSTFYYFFGVSFPLSDEVGFLYFDKSGKFGKMLFSKINEDLVLNKVLPSMFNGSADKSSLDVLISEQINRVIINALAVKGYIE